jgi:hypothetical protein
MTDASEDIQKLFQFVIPGAISNPMSRAKGLSNPSVFF